MAIPITEIRTQAELDAILQESHQHPVLLFKYSPICPISHAAVAELDVFRNVGQTQMALYRIDVIGARPLARSLAEQIKVKHESPQAIVFHNGKPIWNASHGALTREAFLAMA